MSVFLLFFKKTPMMAIFVTMTRLDVMANMMKMTIIVITGYYELASNMVYMGVCSKMSQKVVLT